MLLTWKLYLYICEWLTVSCAFTWSKTHLLHAHCYLKLYVLKVPKELNDFYQIHTPDHREYVFKCARILLDTNFSKTFEKHGDIEIGR